MLVKHLFKNRNENKVTVENIVMETVPDEFDDNFVIFGDDPKRVESLKESESKELWKAVAVAVIGISGRDCLSHPSWAVNYADEVVEAFNKRWNK